MYNQLSNVFANSFLLCREYIKNVITYTLYVTSYGCVEYLTRPTVYISEWGYYISVCQGNYNAVADNYKNNTFLTFRFSCH